MSETPEELVIIGAGAAGLYAAWHAQKAGIKPTLIVDRKKAIGGAWTEMPRDLRCLSPSVFDTLPDARYPKGAGEYALAPDVLNALSAFHESFKPRIAFETPITQIESEEELLCLTSPNGPIRTRKLIVASGIYEEPYIPELPGSFSGRAVHTRHLNPLEFKENEEILVIGSGNSAAEAVEKLLVQKAKVTVAVNNPVQPPHHVHYSGLLGRLRYWASGIPLRWLPGGGGCRDHTPVVRKVLYEGCKDGRIKEVDTIISLNSEGAETRSGQKINVDSIVWATGYTRDTRWLSSHLSIDSKGLPLHKRGISTEDPRIAFIGIPCQRTRRSAFLRGFADDAQYVIGGLK